MTQYPTNPQDPSHSPPYDPYGTYGEGPTKPGSITFLAVVAIVIGGLGSLCSGFATVFGLIQLAGVNMMTGPAAQMKFSPGIQAFGVFDSVMELALYVSLLFIGIGALSLKPWARRAAVSWWSAVMIVWVFIRLIAQIVWVGPASMQAVKQMQQSTPGMSAPQMQAFMNVWMVIVVVFSVVIQLLPPILFLALWRRPAVIAAFEGTVPDGTPDAGNPYRT
jgi:hypothetical protein